MSSQFLFHKVFWSGNHPALSGSRSAVPIWNTAADSGRATFLTGREISANSGAESDKSVVLSAGG